MRRIAVIVSCAMLAGCSSDAAPEPEPALDDPGAFVAVDPAENPGQLALIRILNLFRMSGDTILFFTLYDVNPSDWDDAREIAKRHDLPLRQMALVGSARQITARPHRVVWFRTLTTEERKRVP